MRLDGRQRRRLEIQVDTFLVIEPFPTGAQPIGLQHETQGVGRSLKFDSLRGAPCDEEQFRLGHVHRSCVGPDEIQIQGSSPMNCDVKHSRGQYRRGFVATDRHALTTLVGRSPHHKRRTAAYHLADNPPTVPVGA